MSVWVKTTVPLFQDLGTYFVYSGDSDKADHTAIQSWLKSQLKKNEYYFSNRAIVIVPEDVVSMFILRWGIEQHD